MSSSDKRAESRRKVCIQAFAADVKDTFDIKCIIRDVSHSGCMIVTSNIHELPELVQIIPEGFDKPLAGKIVWRGEKLAGVSFISSNNEELLREVREYFLGIASDVKDGSAKNKDITGLISPLSYSDRLARRKPKMK